jgi:hypothetical protein
MSEKFAHVESLLPENLKYSGAKSRAHVAAPGSFMILNLPICSIIRIVMVEHERGVERM